MSRWVIEVGGAAGTLYAGETYQLQVDFPEHYPMEAPQVIFFFMLRDCTFDYVLCLVD
jgi:ubiquitin-conjugating enzyme E2 W